MPDEKLRPKEAKDLVAYCDQLFSACRRSRLTYERQWYMNMAFYFGRHYVQWAKDNLGEYTRLFEPRAPEWRVRMTINKCRSIIRSEFSKLNQEQPQAYVIPSSTDDDDVAAARAAEKTYEALVRELEYNKERRRASFWLCLTGNGFIKDWYDPVAQDFDGQQGAIKIEHVTPFHLFFPNLQEIELENQPFVIHALAKDPEWVESTFDTQIQPDADAGSNLLEQRFFTALGVPSDSSKSYVSVKEIWIKPCKRYPQGAMILWANGKILQYFKGWPYQHRQFPFTKFEHIPTGAFYSDSVLCDIIPLNKELNRTRSQIVEAKNRMAKPQLAVVKGSIEKNKITSEPGLMVEYKPGFPKPEPIPLLNLPAYVIQELDRLNADMADLSSQHEVSKGQTPPGVSAATAIAYLQESDDSKLAPTITSIEEGTERLAKHWLSHVNQYWDAQRTIKVIGTDNSYEAELIGKANLRGNTDIHVQAGSATPRSRAAKEARLTEWVEKGLIDQAMFFKYADMADTSRIYEEIMIDVRQAQRENIKLTKFLETPDGMAWLMQVQQAAMAGMIDGPPQLPIPANDYDNHIMHIFEHNQFRKKQTYEVLPEEVKMLFKMHVDMHTMFEMQNIINEQGGVQANATQEGQQPANNQSQYSGNGQSRAPSQSSSGGGI